MKIALITLSEEGALLAQRLASRMPGANLYFYEGIEPVGEANRFNSVVALTAEIFHHYEGLIYIAPCGVAVRAVAQNVRDKTQDPAVVVVDVCGRWVISLLSGHEGGANDLAIYVANIIGAEPVITTTTEALKNLIVGVGCRRGTDSEMIVRAIRAALQEADVPLDHVRLLASADIKSDEEGFLGAAKELGVPLRFVSSEEIRSSGLNFQHSDFVQEKVNLPAVAEPAALLAGRRTRLIRNKKNYNGVTVAIAQEDCSW